MAWATRPSDESASGLAEVGRRVGKLGHVSWVDVRTEGSVMHVSYEEGGDEQEEIKHAIREVATRSSRSHTEESRRKTRLRVAPPLLLNQAFRYYIVATLQIHSSHVSAPC